MRRSHLLPLLLSLTFASAAIAAAPAAPGVNLRWDQCYADGGVWNKTFACNTNVGTDQLVGSFELAQALTQVNSVQFVIDIESASSALPAWWSLSYSGGCRSASLDFRPFMDPPPLACVDWVTSPGGGLGAYTVSTLDPAHARVSGVVAVPNLKAVTMSPGVEYFAFRLTLNHAKTVGTGSCAGCNVPLCVFLSRISVFRLGSSTAAIHMEHGANWLGSQYATWQNGYPIDVHHECDPVEPYCARQYTAFGCTLASSTRSRASTWGQVKALYR